MCNSAKFCDTILIPVVIPSKYSGSRCGIIDTVMLNTIIVKPVFDRKHVATKVASRKPVKGLVQLSVLVNGERKFLSTGIRVHLGQFTCDQVVCHEQAKELNDMLANQVAAIIEVVNNCNRKGQLFSWAMLDGLKVRRCKTGTGWIDWMEADIRERPLAEGTRKHHVTVLEFLREQGVTNCSQLTVDTIQMIDDTLHKRKVNGKPMMQVSVYGYHKVLRAYIRRAIRAGVLEHDPYSRFKTNKGVSRPREVLTMDEVRRIQDLQTQSLYMQHVRDLFLLQIWTGLSYADLMTADFTAAADGTLTGNRNKTSVTYTTVMLPQTVEILERYSYHIPVMAYDDYRRMLMPMAELCGIKKHISTHTGRHTFATTIALGHGVPIEILSRMMGHTNIKTTQIYARVQGAMVQEQAERLAGML